MVGRDITTAVEEEEPLSPRARLFQQPSMNCHIILVLGMGKKIDVEEFKSGLESTFIQHPRFSSILVSNGGRHKKPTWVRTKVVTEEHLVVPDMSSVDTSIAADKVVEDYLSFLSTTTMDASRPLWDFHLLNIRTSDAEAVAVLRFHHSLGDGISLMSLLLASTRKISDPKSLPTVPATSRQTTKTHRSFGAFFLRFWAALVLLWHTLVDSMLLLATVDFLQDTKTLLKGSDGVEFRRKRFIHRTVRLDDVKTIKNNMGGTINDVLVGVTSAGLSRYLSRSFVEGHATGKKVLPANIRIRATLMVNIRQPPGIPTLAEMMKGDGGAARWGNCFGFTVMPLSILNCDDPLDYIRMGKAVAERKKNSLEALLLHKLANWISKLFGFKVATYLLHRVLGHTTLTFSNLFGPVEEIGLYGNPLIYVAPTIYGHPQALTLHFQRYVNKLTIVAAVDELSIPDPHQLLDDLVESLKLIKDAVTDGCASL